MSDRKKILSAAALASVVATASIAENTIVREPDVGQSINAGSSFNDMDADRYLEETLGHADRVMKTVGKGAGQMANAIQTGVDGMRAAIDEVDGANPFIGSEERQKKLDRLLNIDDPFNNEKPNVDSDDPHENLDSLLDFNRI